VPRLEGRLEHGIGGSVEAEHQDAIHVVILTGLASVVI
jgi:hypothetical protein